MAARSDRKVSPLRHWQSANRAYDQSMHQFAYHVSGSETPRPAPGSCFAMRPTTSVSVSPRLTGKIDPNELREMVPLHPSYRAMAEANAMPPDDPALRSTRLSRLVRRAPGARRGLSVNLIQGPSRPRFHHQELGQCRREPK
jgi:Family of unknown function (DUF6283)